MTTEMAQAVEDGIEAQLDADILRKYMANISEHRNRRLKEGVKNIYGRHYAVNFN